MYCPVILHRLEQLVRRINQLDVQSLQESALLHLVILMLVFIQEMMIEGWSLEWRTRAIQSQ